MADAGSAIGTVIDGFSVRTWTAASLGGTWTNTVCFTMEVVVSVIYMQHWQLHRGYKNGVYAMLLNDALAALANFISIFLTLVFFETTVPWPVPMGIIANAISAFIGQTFLIHLHWLIARNTLVSGSLMLLVGAQFVTSVVAAVHVTVHPDMITRTLENTPVRIPAVIGASVNALITVCLVWSSRGSPQPRRKGFRNICIEVLSSGALVATTTFVAMIAMLDESRAPAASFISPFMGRFYALTVLANLITRSRYFKPRATVDLGRRGRGGETPGVVESVIFASTRSNAGVRESQWQMGSATHRTNDYALSSSGPSSGHSDDSHGKPEGSLQHGIPLSIDPKRP
ncbi:hypothetical protein DFH09DRAFT_265561 [Mycena vulgaris]|nr:hypothetical protein DFH09DRAFT_265561 [Mycena vulgaris]